MFTTLDPGECQDCGEDAIHRVTCPKCEIKARRLVGVDHALPFVPQWLVVQKRETYPVEVTPFGTLEEAEAEYDRISPNWTETFICLVMKGPVT